MANPQPDQFTKISNELMENLPLYKFNGTQLRIILVLLRYTYGFCRKECEMSLGFISKATGIHKEQIKRELNKLIKLKVVLIVKESDYVHSRILTFNKNYDTWENGKKSLQETKNIPVNEKDYIQESNKFTHTGSELDPQERKIYKENIKETTKGVDDVTELIHYQKIIDLYNSICFELPKVLKATENRKTHVRARWKQYQGNLEFFESYFKIVSESIFLNGNNNRKWKADFDWLMNEANMAKVLEGKYTNKTGTNTQDLALTQINKLVEMGRNI